MSLFSLLSRYCCCFPRADSTLNMTINGLVSEEREGGEMPHQNPAGHLLSASGVGRGSIVIQHSKVVCEKCHEGGTAQIFGRLNAMHSWLPHCRYPRVVNSESWIVRVFMTFLSFHSLFPQRYAPWGPPWGQRDTATTDRYRAIPNLGSKWQPNNLVFKFRRHETLPKLTFSNGMGSREWTWKASASATASSAALASASALFNPIKCCTLTQWGQQEREREREGESLAYQRVFNNWIFNSCKKCNVPAVPPLPGRTNLTLPTHSALTSLSLSDKYRLFYRDFCRILFAFPNGAVSEWNMQIISGWNNFCGIREIK